MPLPALFVAGAALPARRPDALARRSTLTPSAPRTSHLRRVRPARMAGTAEPAEQTGAAKPAADEAQQEYPPPQQRFVPAPPTPTTPMDPAMGAETAVVSVPTLSGAAASAHADWLASLLGAAPAPLPAAHVFAPGAAAAAVRQAPPTRRVEEWRFTDLRAVFAMRFARGAAPPAAPALGAAQYVADGALAALAFVDGTFCAAASAFDDAAVAALRAAGGFAGALADYPGDHTEVAALFDRPDLSGADPPKGASGLFAALNAALARDAAVVHVPAGYDASRPVILLFAATGGTAPDAARASAPRVAVLARENAAVTVVERHVSLPGSGGYALALGCAGVSAAAGASVRHYVANSAAPESGVVLSTHGEVARDARYEVVSVAVGAKVARHSVGIELVGEGSHGGLRGAYVATDYRVADIHSRIVHRAQHTTSNQLQKNIASGHGRTVFSGKIIVTPDGDHTDSEQLCRSLLLSQKAQVDAMPVLEIATDDVKCTHGATVSDLQPDEVFYCQSRGMTAVQARILLISGFVKDVLTDCPVPALLEMVEPIIDQVSTEYQEVKERELELSSI